MLSDVTEAAERAVSRGATPAELEDLARQADGLDLTPTGTEEKRARLAVLLDYLGLRTQAEHVLGTADPGHAPDDPGLASVAGMLAARHGDYGRAVELFAGALPAAPEGSLVRTKVLANLAAASLQAGETAQAAEWLAEAGQARLAAGDPAADVLIASVRAGMAAADGDLSSLRASVSALGEASRTRIAGLGPDHPQALMTVANMATAEFELACAEGSPERQERAVRVLEAATLRLGAELGADQPQALACLADLRTADLVLAQGEGRAQRVALAAAELEAVAQRLAAVLGPGHPQARLAASNAASARPQAPGVPAGFTAGGGGPNVQKARVGALTPLYESEPGRVFLAEEFSLPGDPVPLAYLEFPTENTGRARAVRAAVAFRDQLSAGERGELDQCTAWPRAVVEDESGTPCGFLMPALPAEYLWQLADPDSGELAWQPREMSWLVTSPVQRAAAQIDLPPVDQTDRLVLLGRLIYVVALLHRHGWAFGDLSLQSAAFALDPPRLMLLNCDGAASLSNPGRQQASAPFWDPPESRRAGRRPLQDAETDTYKLGLAVLRCLTPGRGAATTRSAGRLTGTVDAEGTSLIARALSPEPAHRPPAREIYAYVRQAVSARTALPTVAYARLATPYVPSGSEALVYWQLKDATVVTVSVGSGLARESDPAASPDGCAFRPAESGRVVVTARNRFGSVSVDLGHLTVYALPSFAVNLPYLPPVQMPDIRAFNLEPVSALLQSASRIGQRLSESLSPNAIDLMDSLLSGLPSMSSLTADRRGSTDD
ncbi:MAG TPA: hypothetical protein VN969_42615 [Streptosporangiaceae bacterium]|nr:hypothetical protein [Streptosporangiaceae bacterium]